VTAAFQTIALTKDGGPDLSSLLAPSNLAHDELSAVFQPGFFSQLWQGVSLFGLSKKREIAKEASCWSDIDHYSFLMMFHD
jgi:hypothetical protein